MKRPAFALGLAVALALILGGMDRRDAKIIAHLEKDAAEKKGDMKPADQVWMRLPLECDQWRRAGLQAPLFVRGGHDEAGRAMTHRIRAYRVPGGIVIEPMDEDRAYDEASQRADDDRPAAPARTEPTEAPRCRYVKNKTCDCQGRWTCLESA